MAGIKIVDLPALGRDLISTDLLEVSLNGSGSRKITGQEIMNASKLAVGSTPIVSGTVGRLLFQNTGDVLGQSANLFWDATNNRLGIGTSNPQGATHIAVATGTPALVLSDVGSPNGLPTLQFRRGPLSAYSLQIDYPSNIKARFSIGDAVTGYEITGGNIGITGGRSIQFGGITGQTATGIIGSIQTDNNNGQLLFSTRGSGTTAERARITNTGNILINTTTDAGYRLDVNGTARVQGNTTIVGTNSFLFINNTSSGMMGVGFQNAGVDQAYTGIASAAGAAIVGSLTHDYYIRSLNRRIILSANNGGAIQAMLFSTGNFAIGTTTDAGYKLDVNGTARFKDTGSNASIVMQYGTGGWLTVNNASATEAIRLRGGGGASYFNTGQNLLIGTTTDAGYKLDVNGTARVSATNVVSGFQITAPTRAWYFTTSSQGGTFNAISAAANGASGSGNFGYVLAGGWAFNIGLTTSQSDSFFSVYPSATNNGEVRIGGQTGNASSLLTINSTIKGFLPPRMTNAQRAAIASPAVGLIVYCTDSTEGLYVYKSTGWTFMV